MRQHIDPIATTENPHIVRKLIRNLVIDGLQHLTKPAPVRIEV